MKVSSEDIAFIASKLISFPSITPLSAGSIEFLEKTLESLGFTCLTASFGSKQPVANLYAYRGDCGPNLCFVGHLDVVPPGEGWTFPPFDGSVKEGKLLGRGAVDMKGAIASAVVAFGNFNPRARLSFLITTDEEGAAEDGTVKMLRHITSLGHKIDFAIVGEPTCKEKIGECIAISRRGSANFKLSIKGKQGHVAYKESFKSPISKAVKIAAALEDAKLDEETFNPSSLAITSFDVGNEVVNLVPGVARLSFNVRFNDRLDKHSLKERIESIVGKYSNNFELQVEYPSEPFCSPKSDLIEKFASVAKEITGIKPTFAGDGATSDARFVCKYCPCLEFGLQYPRAHQADEWALVEDLIILKDTYLAFLTSLYC